jgi:hypothetical protein
MNVSITGFAAPIGASLAKLFLDHGCKVLGISRRRQPVFLMGYPIIDICAKTYWLAFNLIATSTP